MRDHILTINAGSSSVKFSLFERAKEPSVFLRGKIDGIGTNPKCQIKNAAGEMLFHSELESNPPLSPGDAIPIVVHQIEKLAPRKTISAIGHRIVHGGVDHLGPALLGAKTLIELEKLTPFAPLHQPHNLSGIAACKKAFPNAVQIGCFDTAFHRSHPWVNDTFALPRALYDEGVRRFGFHGLSYEYIVSHLKQVAPHHIEGGVIVAHLGNGASMCALRGGQSVGSSMGFSALDGLPMGTRCGQLDPGVMLYLMDQKGMNVKQIEHMLYRESGLKGLSGISNDMRVLLASNAAEAKQAIDYFVFRIRREIGAMAAVLGGLDGLIFTGGIGENADIIRERICDDMDWIGIELDEDRNRKNQLVVSSDRSRARVFVIPTNEELMIARHVMALT